MSELVKLTVQEQFPEFYREEYPVFVEFMKQYYAYLETTQAGKVESYKDIDASLDSFILQLKNDFAKNVPQFGNLSDREFLLFAKEFYSSRGSEDSYRFLFRAMFGKEIELFYPSTIVFRASDGRWQQDISTRVSFSVGDPLLLADKTVNITDVNGRSLPVYVPKVKFLTGNVWEIYIDRLFTGNVAVGDVIDYNGVMGTVINGASSATVISGGLGYSVGNYFNVNVSGQLLRFRVSRANIDTSIHKVEIIQAGANYTSEVFAKINPSSRESVTNDQTLVGNDALIRIDPGPVLKYPGFYASADGFPSDVMYLQDNEYYQAFSYVIKLDEKLDSYRDIVKRLLHPSGMALWGQYDVSTEVTLNISIEETLRSMIVMVQDEVFWAEVMAKLIGKNFVDVVTHTETLSFSMAKNITDLSPVIDAGSISNQTPQNYSEGGDTAAAYFSEVGTSKYAQGNDSINRTW